MQRLGLYKLQNNNGLSKYIFSGFPIGKNETRKSYVMFFPWRKMEKSLGLFL